MTDPQAIPARFTVTTRNFVALLSPLELVLVLVVVAAITAGLYYLIEYFVSAEN